MHSNGCKKPVVSANGDSLRVQATIKSVHYKFEMSVNIQARVNHLHRPAPCIDLSCKKNHFGHF